jgi:uncharacterized protein YecE (DUF72 family)
VIGGAWYGRCSKVVPMPGTLHVGTSGYVYGHWRGNFYPADLPRSRWFARYTEAFDTVELNSTFYRLPAVATVERWRDQAPRGFRFAVKFSRYGTHMKKLLDPDSPIEKFLARVERLGARLGPILVQLPPRFDLDAERLDAFLAAAPRRHRWAIELRDRRWLTEPVYELLRRRRAALVIHDILEQHPRELTADWTYWRFHGHAGKYEGGYPPQALVARAREIRRQLEDGLDVYAYFNNDQGGHAPVDAADLRRRVAARPSEEPRGRAPSRSRESERGQEIA